MKRPIKSTENPGNYQLCSDGELVDHINDEYGKRDRLYTKDLEKYADYLEKELKDYESVADEIDCVCPVCWKFLNR